MHVKRLEYSRIVARWPYAGKKIKASYVPDHIAQVMVIFFSNKREIKYPSLVHTPQKGLMLSGPRGCGKTMAFEIYRKLIMSDPNYSSSVKLISVREIENEYKLARESKKEAQYLNDLVSYPELIIDDLGDEQTEFNDFGTVRNLIVDLLMLRYPLQVRGQVVTHCTTNLTDKEFPLMYGGRLLDRFREMFVLHILPHNLESKRQHPVKFIPEKQLVDPPMSQLKKNQIYIDLFIKSIRDPESVPFYDLGLMWNILVKNRYVDILDLNDPEIVKQSKQAASIVFNDKHASLNQIQRIQAKTTQTLEQEEERQAKHLVMKRFFNSKDQAFIDQFLKLPSEKILI